VRTDRILRRLEAMLIVLDREHLLLLSGTGDVIAPTDNVLAIGSGGPYALAAARALMPTRRCPRATWSGTAWRSPATSASTPTARLTWSS